MSMSGRPIRFWFIVLAQAIAALVATSAWLWFSAWRGAAIAEMSDQLVIDGYVTPEAAQALRGKHGSIAAYLGQGGEVPAGLAGLCVATLCLAAPVVTIFAARFDSKRAT